MPTYTENAAARERSARKVAQDNHLRSLERQFDLAAKDNTMKYERPSFIVVTASKAYREGWDRIFQKSDIQERTIVAQGEVNETDC